MNRNLIKKYVSNREVLLNNSSKIAIIKGVEPYGLVREFDNKGNIHNQELVGTILFSPTSPLVPISSSINSSTTSFLIGLQGINPAPLPIAQVKVTNIDGKHIRRETMINGINNGESIVTDLKNNVLERVWYVNGRKEGYSVGYFENDPSKIWREVMYSDDLFDGKFMEYFPLASGHSSEVRYEFNFIQGYLSGTSTEYEIINNKRVIKSATISHK